MQHQDAISAMDLPAGFKTDLAAYLMQHQEAISVTLSTEIAKQLQKRYGLSTEQVTQATALAMGAVGGIKGATGLRNSHLAGSVHPKTGKICV